MINNYFTLAGKIALVTGCSSGIGEAMAIGLAEAGADIIGVSSSLQSGSKVEKKIKEIGKKFTPYMIDLGNRNNIYEEILKIKSSHPVIDILINNAGTIKRDPAISHSDEEWDSVLAINLNASFILSREF